MTDSSKGFESDIDLNESIPNSSRSNVTTDDELYDQLMKMPIDVPTHLIPDNCRDEVEGIEHMMKCLNRRYQSYPAVFVGKLDEALKEAFKSQRTDERSPLLIYVNNDKSVYTNIFCKQVLCQEMIINYLTENCLLWTWDVTFQSNCNKLNEIFKNTFSRSTNQFYFKNDHLDQYPLLIGVYRNTQGEYVYERLLEGPKRQMNTDEFLAVLCQFKEKFLQSERDLETRRETIKNEAAARAAQMRAHHFKRYHSVHPNFQNPRDYRAYLSFQNSCLPTDPSMITNAKDFLAEQDMYMEHLHKFERIHMSPDEADDEDDDPEQTPTVERPEPSFQRKKTT